MSVRIPPTVGRIVWIRQRSGQIDKSQPEAAMVCAVHSDTLINVKGVDHNGGDFVLTSLRLVQPDEPETQPQILGPYAEWMPFQKGQAAK